MSSISFNNKLNENPQTEKSVLIEKTASNQLEEDTTKCFLKNTPFLRAPSTASSALFSCLLPEFPPSPPKTTEKTLSKASLEAFKARAKKRLKLDTPSPTLSSKKTKTESRDLFHEDSTDLNDYFSSSFLKNSSSRGKNKIRTADSSQSAPRLFPVIKFASPVSSKNSLDSLSDDDQPFFSDSAQKTKTSSPVKKSDASPSPKVKAFFRKRAIEQLSKKSSPSQNLSSSSDIPETEKSSSTSARRKDLNTLFASSVSPVKNVRTPTSLSSEAFNSPPKKIKGKEDAEILSSPISSNKKISVLSATPVQSHGGKTKQERMQPLFSNPQDISTDLRFSDIEKTPQFNPQLVYMLDNAPHNLVKQAGNKSCGAASLLMLYTDILRKNTLPFDLKNAFWEWYGSCCLTGAEYLCHRAECLTNLKAKNLKLEYLRLPAYEDFSPMESAEINICTVEEYLKTSGLPCVLSITHPHIEGHWIVVDSIEDEEIALRDPFAGKAYKISKEFLKKCFSEDPQSLIYCTTIS